MGTRKEKLNFDVKVKEKCPAKITKFPFAYFHVLSPYATKYTT